MEPKNQYENILESVLKNRNVLIHGVAGVGKSHTLRNLAKKLRDDFNKRVYLTATTGVAAVNLAEVANGLSVSTLHRFAGIGTAQGTAKELISKIKITRQCVKRWQKCQVLIIDEVSMLGGQLFQKLNVIAQSLRNNLEFFGGIQLIVSGDFLQLPPVKDTWIFQTPEWESLNFRPFVLEKPYRYDNLAFFEMLLRIRKGNQTHEDLKVLRTRVRANKKMQELLSELSYEKVGEIIRPTMFYSKRCDVDSFNQRELEKLPGESVDFIARDSFNIFRETPVKDDYMRILEYNTPAIVSFKVGAQVMLKKNIDIDAGLVNGSRGVVSEIVADEALIVKFLNGKKIRIEMATYELEDKYAKATRIQIPFILAWSSTIHKSQGSTLDYAVVDLGPSVFSDGQAYVALSRCKSVDGLFVSEFYHGCIKANKDAVKYANELEIKAKYEDSLDK